MKQKGTRKEVMNNNALMTGGGLIKSNLKYNKYGKIVSIKMSNKAKQRYSLYGGTNNEMTRRSNIEMKKKEINNEMTRRSNIEMKKKEINNEMTRRSNIEMTRRSNIEMKKKEINNEMTKLAINKIKDRLNNLGLNININLNNLNNQVLLKLTNIENNLTNFDKMFYDAIIYIKETHNCEQIPLSIEVISDLKEFVKYCTSFFNSDKNNNNIFYNSISNNTLNPVQYGKDTLYYKSETNYLSRSIVNSQFIIKNQKCGLYHLLLKLTDNNLPDIIKQNKCTRYFILKLFSLILNNFTLELLELLCFKIKSFIPIYGTYIVKNSIIKPIYGWLKIFGIELELQPFIDKGFIPDIESEKENIRNIDCSTYNIEGNINNTPNKEIDYISILNISPTDNITSPKTILNSAIDNNNMFALSIIYSKLNIVENCGLKTILLDLIQPKKHYNIFNMFFFRNIKRFLNKKIISAINISLSKYKITNNILQFKIIVEIIYNYTKVWGLLLNDSIFNNIKSIEKFKIINESINEDFFCEQYYAEFLNSNNSQNNIYYNSFE